MANVLPYLYCTWNRQPASLPALPAFSFQKTCHSNRGFCVTSIIDKQS